MNNRDHRIGAVLGVTLLLLLAMPTVSFAQKKKTSSGAKKSAAPVYRYAYEHGYRAGYEDGFTQGKSDIGRQQGRDFEKNDAYNRADRTYEDRMGTYVEYQEGYRFGFELGHGDGYFGRPYTTTIPANLGRLVTATINASNRPSGQDDRRPSGQDERRPSGQDARRPVDDERPPAKSQTSVPPNIQMKLRLDTRISTKDSREGDQFTARVLDPSGYADGVVTGHIARLKKSGSATGKTELSLAFDSIELRDGRTLKLDAQVEKVYESENVKSVDDEGNVQTGSRTKDTTVRTGGGAALGAIIGAVAGGGKGAAIGAAIGAGVGAGSVFIEGGKQLTLEPGTEILIRTAGPDKDKKK